MAERKSKSAPRRDRCELIGRRGKTLSEKHMANAWGLLCQSMVELGERDMPKFEDVLKAIRLATIRARHAKHNPEWDKAQYKFVVDESLRLP